MIDYSVEWITVTTREPGKSQTLTTVVGLAEFLLAVLPDAKAAQTVCLDVLEGRAEPAAAREAFAKAAVEGGLHIIEVTRPPSTGKIERWHKRKPRRRS